MAACNDSLMRAVVLTPGWARNLRGFVRSEYGGCAEGWFLAQLTANGRSPARQIGRIREFLRRMFQPAPRGRPTEV